MSQREMKSEESIGHSSERKPTGYTQFYILVF